MKEFAIILAITYFGEMVSRLINFPIPGPVIGMIILFLLLKFSLLKVKQVENATVLLLGNLAILFIPPGVKLISALDLLHGNLIKIISLMIITTILTMATTGLTVQFLINRKLKND